VPQLRLVAPWKEAQALLENERHSEAAMEAFENMCRTVAWQAAEMVFWAVSVEDGIDYRAVERELLVIGDLEETAPRPGLQAEDLLAETHSYVDRFGDYKAPNGATLEGRRLCPECPRPPDRPGWQSRGVRRGEIRSELGAVTSWPARRSTCLLW
jgi:hypothetical protein